MEGDIQPFFKGKPSYTPKMYTFVIPNKVLNISHETIFSMKLIFSENCKKPFIFGERAEYDHFSMKGCILH